MRTRALLAAVAATLLAPSAARAGYWNLRLGLEYIQADSWNVEGNKTSLPRLDLNLALDAGGALGGPGVADWGAYVHYRRLDTKLEQVQDVRNVLDYRLRLMLFQDPRSPARVGLHAARAQTDFTTEGNPAGSYDETSYGGDLLLNPGRGRPWLRGAYNFSDASLDSVAVGRSTRTLHTVNAGTGAGAPNFTYNAAYRGNFSEGTYEFDNYDDHRVDVNADVDVQRNLKLSLSDVYFVRKPTTSSDFNPRQELNSFSAVLNHLGGGADVQLGTYQYTHGLQSTPNSEELERALHRLGYSIVRELANPEWRIRGNVDATYAEDRLGADTTRNAGQSLGAIAYWRRPRPNGGFLELRGGPKVGAVEPEGRDASFGYGGSAGVTHQRRNAITTLLTYDVGYDQDTRGELGWSLRQSALASAEGALGMGFLTGTLQASSQRSDTSLFGDTASRFVQGTLAYRVRRSDVQLQAGLQEGVLGTASVTGDGLFLAPPFDSRTAYATLSASTTLWRYVGATARARWSSTDVPDRPTLDETEALGRLDWMYGALRISLEDRYVISEIATGTIKYNQITLRATRVFGSRF